MKIHVVLWLALVLLAGCDMRDTVHFPRQLSVQPPPPYPAASLVGTLVITDNCVRISSLAETESYAPIWPATFSLIEVNGEFAIQNSAGEILAFIGDNVSLGGGTIPDNPAIWQQFEVLRQGPPTECAGPYWLASTELRNGEVPDKPTPVSPYPSPLPYP